MGVSAICRLFSKFTANVTNYEFLPCNGCLWSFLEHLEGEQVMADMINKPAHYTSHSFEVRDVIDEVAQDYKGDIAWNIGNVLKYVMRAPFKGNLLEDLKKAANYLGHAIELIERDNNG